MFDGLKKLVGKESTKEKRDREAIRLNWQNKMEAWQSSFAFDQSIQPNEKQTLSGHSSSVLSLMLLPDGRLASGSKDKSIKLWDVERGECVLTLSGHSESVYSLTLLSDGRLASGSRDNSIKLWDVDSGLCVSTLFGHSGSIHSLTLLPDGRLASGSEDNSIKLWDVKRGECVSTLKVHCCPVGSLTLLPDGRLASCILSVIKLWDVERGKCVSTLSGHSDLVRCLTLLSDGRLASGSVYPDHSIKLWDVERGKCVSTLSGHSNINSLTLLPDGRLASGSDNSIKLWDVERNECVSTLEGSRDAVVSLTLLLDGRLASGSWDKSIKLWDVGLRPKAGLGRAAYVNPSELGLVVASENFDIKEHSESEKKACLEREPKENIEQEPKEPEVQERQQVEKASDLNAAVDVCKWLRSRWRVDAVEILCDRYASMIEAMPKLSALTVERAAYFVFLAKKSSELDQQITWYEKALNDCDKAWDIDQSNSEAETEKARLRELLVPLRQEQEKRSALASLHEQWQTLDPKQLLNEYQTLIDQHPEDSDYCKAQGEYYVFCGEKAKLMAQKSNFYKKATSVFESVLEKDCFDEAAATRIEEISLMLSDLSQTSSSSSGNASIKAPNKGLHIDRLGIEGSHCIEESELAFLSVLGKGGFGEVKLARWGGNKPVAVKKCLTDCDKDAVEEVGRLNDEAVIMKSLDHPGILKLLGFLTVTNHLQGIVLEYCPQGTLHDFIKKHSGNITKQLRLSFAIDLCEAIAYLHSRDPHIVHKDLNSRNVLLTEGMQIKVADFGISAVREEKTKKTAHTQTIAGTTRYMAPELFENHQANTASDVWAMGMVLFEIFTNDVPYSDYSAASNMMALMLHIRDKNLPHIPTDYAEEYPQQMASINKCWATNWQDRAEAKTISLDFREIQSAEGNTGDVSVSFDEFTS